MKITNLLAAVLLFPCCASLVSAASIVTQFQWGDGSSEVFGPTPVIPVAAPASVDLVKESNVQTNGAIRNYVAKSPGVVTNGILDESGNAISDVRGPGLSYILQTSGADVFSFILRSNVRRLNPRARFGTGTTQLFWSEAAAVTNLLGLTWELSIGPGSQGYQEGIRAAIQDTAGNWLIGMTASGDTTEGLQTINLETEMWAPYTPADLAATSLVTFDSAGASFATFTGDVQAFGFFSQNTGDVNWRINGFQVTAVPEPGSVALLGFASLGLFLRRCR